MNMVQGSLRWLLQHCRKTWSSHSLASANLMQMKRAGPKTTRLSFVNTPNDVTLYPHSSCLNPHHLFSRYCCFRGHWGDGGGVTTSLLRPKRRFHIRVKFSDVATGGVVIWNICVRWHLFKYWAVDAKIERVHVTPAKLTVSYNIIYII